MDNRALIFDMVHGSFVDGWGIRTTIFLKGCPLKCVWCCNPEGQSLSPELKLISEHCDGCGKCLPACELKALSLEDGLVSVNRSKCTVCGECFEACPTNALAVFGTWYTPEQVFELIKNDRPFYQMSGGGLTIGGGEATMYPKFCLELIELCHKAGIKVAIDTCGYTTTREGLEVLEKADLLLFDLKGMNSETHRRNTGVSNKHIHKNIEYLSNTLGKEIIVRVPVIPRVNDAGGELARCASYIASLKSVKRVDILPVHHYGKVKYGQIGKKYTVDSDLKIPESRQKEILELFKSYGLTAQIGG